MQGDVIGRGRWQFADWHHELCSQWECEKNFCRLHRRVFWICQDAVYDKTVNYFGGSGDCVSCVRDRWMQRLKAELGLFSTVQKVAS